MNSNDILSQVDMIRQVFSYAHRFREKTFVIHVDYGTMDDDRLNALVQDVVLLHQAGIRIVLVPGARQRIDEVLTRYDIPWKRVHGMRIATKESIPFIKMAAFDVSNHFMTVLSGYHTNAVVGNWVRARGIGVVDGVDYEHTGLVERIQLDLLRSTLEQGMIPIFPCIGWSVSGKPYNISSRELAYRIATSINAEKLFFIGDKMGLTTADLTVPPEIETTETGRISRLTVEESGKVLEANGYVPDEWVETSETDDRNFVVRIASGYFTGIRDDVELLRLAHSAARNGVDRVHLVSGRHGGVILVEVFSNLGVGTMVYANVYQSIRSMRPEDVLKVYRLMEPLADQGVLIRRSPEDIAANYADYVVYETDERVLGCGALHRYSNGEAEIAAIAIDPEYEEMGIGRRIVLYLMERARQEGIPAVFALTTRTGDWFESIGYHRIGVKDLPREKRERYNVDRNSTILRYRF